MKNTKEAHFIDTNTFIIIIVKFFLVIKIIVKFVLILEIIDKFVTNLKSNPKVPSNYVTPVNSLEKHSW